MRQELWTEYHASGGTTLLPLCRLLDRVAAQFAGCPPQKFTQWRYLRLSCLQSLGLPTSERASARWLPGCWLCYCLLWFSACLPAVPAPLPHPSSAAVAAATEAWLSGLAEAAGPDEEGKR